MEKDLAQIRKEKFAEALAKTYSGCVFDIDGTLTIWGEELIPAFAYEHLAKLTMTTTVAVCTARSLKHAYEAIAPVFTHANNPEYCQGNWLFFCENGGLGYVFDRIKNDYVEFFRIQYPYTEEQREKMFIKLKSALEGKLGHARMNEISFVFKPVNYQETDKTKVKAACHEIAEIVLEKLKSIDPKGTLRVGDSGTGVNVYPYSGDKENGIIQFAKYLRDKMGISISKNASELVVLGDQPQPNGNDVSFLNGKYGTPFTVGEVHPENVLPLPVYDPATGAVLKGPEATISLINQLKFRNI